MARIRTVKPEFWSHKVMGRLDDITKNMAIALLNYADDLGYFYADPILVRNFCRPFDDDSANTRGALANLSRIGYITIAEDTGHGEIGKIVNFTLHQKIDKPSQSRIERYFDSTSPPRALPEPSPQEVDLVNGSSNMEKDKKSSEPSAPTRTFDHASEPFLLSELIMTLHRKRDPVFLSGKDVEKTLQKWSIDIDKIIRIDGRDFDTIREVISFSQSSEFWNSNILSGSKLREKFDTLFSQSKSQFKPKREEPSAGKYDPSRPKAEVRKI